MKRLVRHSVLAILACGIPLAACDPESSEAEGDRGDDFGLTEAPLRRQCSLEYADIRVAVGTIPADGVTKIPVLAIARTGEGRPSLEPMVVGVSPASAGTIAPSALVLSPSGTTTFFTPCHGGALGDPACVGPFELTMARASNPADIIARTPMLNLATPSGVGSPAACLTGGNVAFFDGDSDDVVHPGRETKSDAHWWVDDRPNGSLELLAIPPDPYEPAVWWYFAFESTLGQPLDIGVYENVARFDLPRPSRSGMEIEREGHFCSTVMGRFEVHELNRYPDGTLQSVTATFEQRCDGSAGALRGCVHFEQ